MTHLFKSRKDPVEIDPEDTISLDEARERFHEYYNERSPSRIGRFRAKVGDIRYRKSDEYILYPDSPGSAKYLLPDGPRKYDMMGVDAFPPEQEYVEYEDPDYGKTRVKLLGKPKTKSGVEYRDYFKEKYHNARKTNVINDVDVDSNASGVSNASGSSTDSPRGHLVETYWKQYKKLKEESGYTVPRARSCRKKTDVEKGRTIMSFREDNRVPICDFRRCKNLLFVIIGRWRDERRPVYIDASFRCYNETLEEIPLDDEILGYLERGGYIVTDNVVDSPRPQWKADIFDAIVYYHYRGDKRTSRNADSAIPHTYRLHLKTMEVFDETRKRWIGKWLSFLKNRGYKPLELIPYRIVIPTATTCATTSEEDIETLIKNPKRIYQYIPTEMKLYNTGFHRMQIGDAWYYVHCDTHSVVPVDKLNTNDGQSIEKHIQILSNITDEYNRRYIIGRYNSHTKTIVENKRVTERQINKLRDGCAEDNEDYSRILIYDPIVVPRVEMKEEKKDKEESPKRDVVEEEWNWSDFSDDEPRKSKKKKKEKKKEKSVVSKTVASDVSKVTEVKSPATNRPQAYYTYTYARAVRSKPRRPILVPDAVELDEEPSASEEELEEEPSVKRVSSVKDDDEDSIFESLSDGGLSDSDFL
jgi:hypothetical protein